MCVEGQRTTWRSLSLHHIGPRGLNPGHQSWQQAPLHAEMSCWPIYSYFECQINLQTKIRIDPKYNVYYFQYGGTF